MNLFADTRRVQQIQHQTLIATPDGTFGASQGALCRAGALWKAIAMIVSVAVMLQVCTVRAQVTTAIDPTMSFSRLFGLGGHACKQYDDTGRLYIYSEGIPSPAVISWLQRSNNGTKANVSMPAELSAALPLIPGCLPGKHHAASSNG
jgi:hypothetical protein